MKSFPTGYEVLVDANDKHVVANLDGMVDANGLPVVDTGCSDTDCLILAAPELLAALKRVEERLRYCIGDGYSTDKVDEEIADEARALIARVEGK